MQMQVESVFIYYLKELSPCRFVPTRRLFSFYTHIFFNFGIKLDLRLGVINLLMAKTLLVGHT